MRIKKIVMVFLGVLIIYIYSEKPNPIPMEEFNLSSAFGVDIKKEAGNTTRYKIPFNIYKFKNEGKQDTKNKIGESLTIGGSREDRQLNSNKIFLIGIQKVILLSEEAAKNGMSNLINVNFANPQTNDRSYLVVCKGSSEDMFSMKLKGYNSSGDYIAALIDNSVNYNFLDKEYTLLNVYVRLDTEGRNLVLPYIEVKNNEIVISGNAVFKKDKLKFVLPIEEAKFMNILRARSAKGILTIQENQERYINYDAKFKKSVKCSKKDGKYEFDINLNFNGNIISDNLYKNMTKENKKEVEDLMAKKIEGMCNVFLHKMQKLYKIDMLELGMYGAAKYGRDTGVDWDKAVSDANIKVNVKVNIDNIGRGHS